MRPTRPEALKNAAAGNQPLLPVCRVARRRERTRGSPPLPAGPSRWRVRRVGAALQPRRRSWSSESRPESLTSEIPAQVIGCLEARKRCVDQPVASAKGVELPKRHGLPGCACSDQRRYRPRLRGTRPFGRPAPLEPARAGVRASPPRVTARAVQAGSPPAPASPRSGGRPPGPQRARSCPVRTTILSRLQNQPAWKPARFRWSNRPPRQGKGQAS